VGIHHYKLNGKLASSVLTFYFRDRLLPYYGASEPTLNASAPKTKSNPGSGRRRGTSPSTRAAGPPKNGGQGYKKGPGGA